MERVSLLVVVGCALVARALAEDTRIPLIGILMQGGRQGHAEMLPDPTNQYMYAASSYVEWISHTGATPVLIPYNIPLTRLKKMLDSLNGVLLPGGGMDLKDENEKSSPYQIVSEEIIKYSEEKFDRENIVFPIFGTCLGFETVMMRYGTNPILTNGFNDLTIDHPIILNETAFMSSKFFSKLDQATMRKVFMKPAMYYTHNLGVKYDTLRMPEFTRIFDEMLILGSSRTGVHHDGIQFVTLVEHRRYPVYGVQFHPEKTLYERQDPYGFLDRSSESIALSTDIAYTFVDIARENAKQYPDIPEWIKPYIATYWTPINTAYDHFEKVYIVPNFYSPVISAPSPIPVEGFDREPILQLSTE